MKVVILALNIFALLTIFFIHLSSSTSAADCIVSSNTSWNTIPFSSQTGTFTIEFDATPHNNNIDGITGLSAEPAHSYNYVASIIRFNTSGNIDARNGAVYQAESLIPYSLGYTYHFKLLIDIPNHTYSAFVDFNGQSQKTIASNHSFRTEQNDVTNLGYLNVYSETGSHTVCNLNVYTSPSGIPGDADGNYKVDIDDYLIWLTNIFQPKTGPSFGDFDYSDSVDGVDYTIFMKNYSYTISTPTPTSNPTSTSTPTKTVTYTPTPTQPIGEGKLIYTSSFETGSLQCGGCNPDGWNTRIDNGPSNAIQVLSNSNLPITPRDGNYALRIHAEKTSSQATTRAELEGWKHNFFELGKEYWVGYSIYLPSNGEYEFDSRQSEILSQYRHRDDSSCAAVGISPPNSLEAQSGRWQWEVRCNDTKCACDGSIKTKIDIGPQITGKWTDFVIRLRFSSGSSGILQVWKDGSKVVDRVNKPNYYPNSNGPYIKFGFYKWFWGSNSSDVNVRTIYYDSIKVYEGTNGYKHVSP